MLEQISPNGHVTQSGESGSAKQTTTNTRIHKKSSSIAPQSNAEPLESSPLDKQYLDQRLKEMENNLSVKILAKDQHMTQDDMKAPQNVGLSKLIKEEEEDPISPGMMSNNDSVDLDKKISKTQTFGMSKARTIQGYSAQIKL